MRCAPCRGPRPGTKRSRVRPGNWVGPWLGVRWCDDPDSPAADRYLVLIAYLIGLGYANHMAGMLAAPAVGLAVLIRRPSFVLRWKLLVACGVALFFGGCGVNLAYIAEVNRDANQHFATVIWVNPPQKPRKN